MERLTPEQAAVVGKSEQRQMSQREALQVATEERVLRQWCIEKAIQACAGGAVDPIGIAEQIWRFITPHTQKERP